MATISVSLPNDGDTIDAADYNTPITTIVNAINGGLDNDNIASGAAITGSKIADNSIDIGAKASTWDGWIAVSDSWSYASSTTVTVPTDATTKYSVGDKVKFTQTTVKYFTITAVAATVLTLSGQGGVTVANAAISAISYSHSQTPVGNSDSWISWTPTFVNWTIGTGGSAGTTAKYKQIGKSVFFYIHSTLGTSGQSVGNDATFSLPVTAASGQVGLPLGNGYIFDAGASNYDTTVWLNSTTTALLLAKGSGGAFVALSGTTSTNPITWAAGDSILYQGFYEAA